MPQSTHANGVLVDMVVGKTAKLRETLARHQLLTQGGDALEGEMLITFRVKRLVIETIRSQACLVQEGSESRWLLVVTL